MISNWIVAIIVVALIVLWFVGRNPPAAGRMRIYQDRVSQGGRAIDHYQVAAEYDYVEGDRQRATEHYERALILGVEEPEHVNFIRERIQGRILGRATQRDEAHQFEIDLQRIWDQTAPRVVVSGIQWHEDTQNVHDTLLSDLVADQYRQLASSSGPYRELNSIIQRLRDEKVEGADAAGRMLAYMRDQKCYITKLDAAEPQVIQAVWKCAEKTRDARQSFATALVDSWNGGSPHCVTGRVSRVVQSLAHMVPDQPNLGILRTRESLRNEIFTSAAKIRDDQLAESGLTEVYQQLEPSQDDQRRVLLLQAATRKAISGMIDRYSTGEFGVAVAAADLAKIKEECYYALE